ncbi:ATP-binding cassette domain-containing protein [Clostridium perfringens]|nr:ATP-binding cassette domain-containing protein [Clostridium perfringens]
MFQVRNVSKNFNGEFALREVSFEINGGLNFIIGASGSGKTTLLKILSGMEQDFQGDVLYKKKSVKYLTNKEKSNYYNNIFGFVWQDFNLIENLTVEENIRLPLYLKDNSLEESVKRALKQLKLKELAKKKVKELSGGQKQRVAIARELVKNPEVIIADEPTAALDAKSAAIIMDLLKQIAKTRTVIIVTHDTSFIDENSSVFELDKGELISEKKKNVNQRSLTTKFVKSSLGIGKSINIALSNIKSKLGGTVAIGLSILISTTLLISSLGGSISNSNEKIFDELFKNYGESILDISLIGSFMSASGTDGSEETSPGNEVNQNIQGLYEKYSKDDRVKHILFSTPISDTSVKVDGKEVKIETTNNTPVLNELLAGDVPKGEKNEVVIPKYLAEKLGEKPEDLIGKELDFKGSLFNWENGNPIHKEVNIKAKIVGVADNTIYVENFGQVQEFSIDDSFFFSKSALDEMRNQAGIKKAEENFVMRMKTPEDVIAVKDELNSQGIVPLGRFELIEDIVRLNAQTGEQSGVVSVVIGIISVFAVLSIVLITAIIKKREYAIYKISGYSSLDIMSFTSGEYGIVAIGTIIIFLLTSPLINKITESLFSLDILNIKSLILGSGLILFMSILSAGVTGIIESSVKEGKCLKSGER